MKFIVARFNGATLQRFNFTVLATGALLAFWLLLAEP
jgi:hypothetical protein